MIKSEVLWVVQTAKINKAPGPNGIENLNIKLFVDQTTQPLTDLFNAIMEGRTVPKQWCISKIILLHKKGDRAELSPY